MQQNNPGICDIIRTDCKDGTGIAELRAAIERETDRLEHLRAAFPAAWFAIKDELADMKKTLKTNYLSFDQFRDVCRAKGEVQALEPLAVTRLVTSRASRLPSRSFSISRSYRA